MQNLVICAKDRLHVRKCVQVSEKERTMRSTSGTLDKEAHVVKWRSHANSVASSLQSKLPSMRLFAELSAISQGRWRARFQQMTSSCRNAPTPLETIVVPQHPRKIPQDFRKWDMHWDGAPPTTKQSALRHRSGNTKTAFPRCRTLRPKRTSHSPCAYVFFNQTRHKKNSRIVKKN